MRKLFICLITFATFIGCSNEEKPFTEAETVSFSLDYSFVESGSMSRSGNNIYTDFYEKYIKTKQVTPRSYSLTIRNSEGEVVESANGMWGNKDMVSLLEGEYHISGSSASTNLHDTLSLAFDEKIIINKNTTQLTLKANYNCYMVFLDQENFSSVNIKYNSSGGREQEMSKKDNIYYCFTDFEDKAGTSYTHYYIQGVRVDKKVVNYYPHTYKLEKGKYYYLNDVNEDFTIPPMIEGY